MQGGLQRVATTAFQFRYIASHYTCASIYAGKDGSNGPGAIAIQSIKAPAQVSSPLFKLTTATPLFATTKPSIRFEIENSNGIRFPHCINPSGCSASAHHQLRHGVGGRARLHLPQGGGLRDAMSQGPRPRCPGRQRLLASTAAAHMPRVPHKRWHGA